MPKSILDSSFKYTHSYATNIEITIMREKARLAAIAMKSATSELNKIKKPLDTLPLLRYSGNAGKTSGSL